MHHFGRSCQSNANADLQFSSTSKLSHSRLEPIKRMSIHLIGSNQVGTDQKDVDSFFGSNGSNLLCIFFVLYCTYFNVFQTVMVNKITHHKHVTQNLAAQNINDTKDAIIYYAYPELCKGLQNVSDTCFKNTLTECYDEHDAYFHYVYMLEELKRAGLMISIHLFPEDSNVDVLHCPVFHEASPFGQNEQLIIGLSVALSLVVFCCLVAIGMLIVHKYRIVPRFRAWIQNEPYEDIVIAESNVREMQDVTTIDDTVEVRMAAEEHLPKPEDLQNSMGVQRSRTNEESTQST